MKSLSPHKNLEAWKASMGLVEEIYRLTLNFPSEEKFGLVSQMRGASVSVPSNIAEGAANRTKAQFMNFLAMALGSLSELDTQLEISFRLSYTTEAVYLKIGKLIDRCKALVYGLHKSLKPAN